MAPPLSSSPLLTLLLLALLLVAPALAQTPQGVALTLTPSLSAINVSWTPSIGSATAASYVVKAAPYNFYDSFNGVADPAWVWDAPCGTSCTHSITQSPSVMSIGLTAGTSYGYNPNRGTTPFLLRPEKFDVRADFCASVYVDVKLPNGGYTTNLQGGIVLVDADAAEYVVSRWITTWDGNLGNYWRERWAGVLPASSTRTAACTMSIRGAAAVTIIPAALSGC